MPESPRINQIEWGTIEVERIGRVADVKLWPGGGREWDWRETNTHHTPGIQVSDVEEIVDHGARIVVLSRGMELRLLTRPETLQHLGRLGVVVHVEETKDAVKLYNRLAGERELVGGLFHSTC